MATGSVCDAAVRWGVAVTGLGTGRDGDPREGRNVPASNSGLGRQWGSRWWVLPVGVAALVGFVVALGTGSLRGGGFGPLSGFLTLGVVGLAASSEDDPVATLTEKVERARAGEPVDIETDREDGLADLAAAVDGLVDDYQACERERDMQERAIESAPVGITIADMREDDQPMISVNERFEELTGYDESESVGRNCRFLQGEDTDEDPIAEMRRAIEAGEETTVELRNYRKDGTEFWNRVRLAPVENEAGEVTHYVGFQEDVTERVERERELERAESLLDSIFEQLPVNLYVKDEEARHVRVSEAHAKGVYDWDAEEMIGKTDPEIFDGEFAEETLANDRHVIETGEPIVEQEEYLDGIDEWNLTTKVPWRGEDGEIRGLLGLSIDITERKQREQELERAESMLDSIFEQFPLNIYVKDEEARHVRVSEAFVDDAYPWDAEEMIGKTDPEIFDPELADESFVEAAPDLFDGEFAEESLADDLRVIETGERMVHVEEHLEGTDDWGLTTKVPWRGEDGEIRGLLGISIDISERKERERELERQESLLDSIFEQVPVHLYVKDREARYQRVSSAYIDRAYGWDDEDVLGHTDLELFDEDHDVLRESYEDDMRVIEEGEPIINKEEHLEHVDEWNLTTKVFWRGEDGEIRGVFGVSQKITERKERERELEQYRQYTDDILDAMDDVFYVLDDDGDLLRWNETLADVSGYTDAEIAEMSATEFVPEDDADAVANAVENIEDVAGVPLEVSLLTKDGETIPYEFVAAPMENPDGEQVIAGIGRDISGRKERERQLEAIVENTEEAIYIKDREARYQFINEAGAAVFGAEPSEIVGKSDAELFGEETVEEITADDREVFETGEPVVREGPRLIDGEERIFRDYKYPYRDENGDIIGVVGVSRDVTEPRRRQQELREREQRLDEYKEYTEDTLDAIDDVFYVFDDSGQIQRWNDSLNEVTGYTDDEIEAMHGTEFFPPEYHEQAAEAISTVFETGEDRRVDAPVLTKDGEAVPYEFVATRVENPDGEQVLVGVGRDISVRKQRERDLRETNEQLSAVVEASPAALVAFDDSEEVTLWNDAAERIFGWSESEVLGEPLPIVPENRRGEHDDYFEWTAEGVRVTSRETKHLRKDGERIDVSLSLAPLRDSEGDIVGTMCAIVDITERKAAERELRDTKNRLQRFIETSPVGVVATTPDGEVTLWNDAMEDIFGWSAEEVLGEPHPAVPEDQRGTDETRQRVLDGESVRQVERKRVRKDGEEIDISLSATPIRDENGEVSEVVGYIEDITERKERERELAARSAAMEQSIDGMAILDEEGRYEFVNQAHAEVYGYDDPERFVGETWEVCYGDDERERLADEALSALETEGDWRGEAVGQRADGSTFPQEVSLTRLADGRIICVVRDITERKERQQELERTTHLLSRAEEMADIGGWTATVDPEEGESVRWTDNLYDIFERSPEDGPLADGILDYIHPADREAHAAEIERAFEDGEPWDTEYRITTDEGTERWVHSICEPVVEDGAVVELRGSVQDITERKEREREIERTADLLARAEEMADLGGWTQPVTNDGLGPVEWTDNLYDIFEVSREVGPLDEDLFEYVHPDDREAHRAENRRAVEDGEPWDTEYRIITGEGTERWVHSICEPVVEDDEVVDLRGSVQNITERKERERELERTKDMLQQAGRIAAVGGWEIDLTGDEPELEWTDELYRLHGVEPGTEVDLDTAIEYYHPEDREMVEREVRAAIEQGKSYDMEGRLQPEGESVRWVRAIGEPVYEDGEVVRVRGSVQDITGQKERELALESLHEATRGLLGVESDTETADLVVETAQDVLDVAGVAVYLLDDSENHLDAVACSEGFDQLCDAAPVGASTSESLLWNTYVTGTPTVFDDTQTVADSEVFGPAVSGGLLVPIGNHGVFVVATRDRAVDQGTRQLVETLVATTEAAFDRLSSRAEVDAQKAELKRKADRLSRQIQITDLLRRIDQSLIQAESRAEVEAAVCDQLVESEDVAFAWIGALDASGQRVEPSAWAGDGTDYLDSVSLSLGGERLEPAAATAASEAPTVVSNVVENLKREEWRKTALSEGFQSVVSVPLAFEEYFYGVLTVYADEPDAFGETEQEVFAELGENIAHSINAVETQRALHSDQRVELALDFDADDDVLGRLATAAGCTVEFAGLAAQTETETDLFVTTTGASADRVASVLEDLVSVGEYRLIRDATADEDGETPPEEGDSLFEITVGSDTLPARFVRHGAGPRSITAAADGIEAVVDVPTATDVRAFVEMLAETHPSVDLVSRRSVDRGDEGGTTLASSLFEALTDRQLEVLRTAYFAGFFEWPRTSTGEDVAEMLDVSQPTVNRHLRLGQQRLLEQLFEERSAEVAAEAD